MSDIKRRIRSEQKWKRNAIKGKIEERKKEKREKDKRK